MPPDPVPDHDRAASVIKATCAEFNLTRSTLRSDHKGGRFTAAREVCCHLLTRSDLDDDELAKLLGLHRSAILKMRRSACSRVKKSKTFSEKVERIRRATAATETAETTEPV